MKTFLLVMIGVILLFGCTSSPPQAPTQGSDQQTTPPVSSNASTAGANNQPTKACQLLSVQEVEAACGLTGVTARSYSSDSGCAYDLETKSAAVSLTVTKISGPLDEQKIEYLKNLNAPPSGPGGVVMTVGTEREVGEYSMRINGTVGNTPTKKFIFYKNEKEYLLQAAGQQSYCELDQLKELAVLVNQKV